jgi:type II secretory pathway pseudopilin PulG
MLVELLVVLVITGICSVAVPSDLGFKDRAKSGAA